MELPGPLLGELIEAIKLEFTESSLEELLATKFEKSKHLSDTRGPGDDFPTAIRKLIEKANNEGWLPELLKYICEERPKKNLPDIRDRLLVHDLYADAQEAFKNQNWQAAQKKLEEVQKLIPGYEDTENLLKIVQEEQELADLYSKGQKYYADGKENYKQALTYFRQLKEKRADYRDVPQLIKVIDSYLTSERPPIERTPAQGGISAPKPSVRVAYIIGGISVLIILAASIALYIFFQRTAKAEGDLRLSRSQTWAKASIDNLELDKDPELSILMALRAVSETYSVDQTAPPRAIEALHRAIQASRVRLTLADHQHTVFSVAFSPDGKHLATASQDKRVIIWDTGSGEKLFTLDEYTEPIQVVAFSSDGKLATASADGTTWIWDADGQQLHTLKGHKGKVNDATFSPDVKYLATAGEDGTAIIWNVSSGEMRRAPFGHADEVYGVAFSPNGMFLATVGQEEKNRAKIWDVDSGRTVYTLTGHIQPVWDVAFSPDGKRLATASRDKTVKVWNVACGITWDAADCGKELHNLTNHTDGVYGVAFSPDGTRLATASRDQTTKIWAVDKGIELFTLLGHTSTVWGVAFSPDGKHLATASEDKTAKIWSVAVDSEEELSTLKGYTDTVRAIAFTPNGQHLLDDSGNGTITVRDLVFGQTSYTLIGHTKPVLDIVFSPDGKRLATASGDETARLWNVARNYTFDLSFPHASAVHGVVFSPNGMLLATISKDKTAKIWDINTGKLSLTLDDAKGPFYGVAFSPDGKRLATGSKDGNAKVWNVDCGEMGNSGDCGQELHDLPATGVQGVAFSPDGARLATVKQDGEVIVWKLDSAEQLLTFQTDKERVLSIAFSPDGKYLATAGLGGAVKVWNADDGQERVTLSSQQNQGSVFDVVFSSDGKFLATASSDQLVRIYVVDIGELLGLAKKRATRSLTLEECQGVLSLEYCK